MALLYGGLFTIISLGVLISAQQLQSYVLDNLLRGDEPCLQERCDPETLRETVVSTQQMTTVLTMVALTVLAFGLSWWLTGRLLRPLRRITDTARRLSLSTLHERIALAGRPDELTDLADTFDAMLDRLQDSVDRQRRFVANASHELRTPLAVQRTAIEVGLDDPPPDLLVRVRTELLRNVERSERLIEGLLALAQGEQGSDERVDLAAVVGQVLADHPTELAVRTEIDQVTVAGDEVMLARLTANLIQNAIRHNVPGGSITVRLGADAVLIVANTGPVVPPDRVDELFEPFRQLARDRTGSAEGAGLGLSIVAAIVHAHDGTVRAAANPGGGLTVTVSLTPLPG